MKTKTPRTVYLVDGARTPFLKARNKPGPFSASDLAVQAGRTLLKRQPFSPTAFDEVIVGCTMPSENEANIGRVIGLRLGCGDSVPGWTVQRNCASGLQALDNAMQRIASGQSDLVLAGGTDAMSRAPILFNPQMAAWFGQFATAKTLPQRLKMIAQFKPRYLKPVIALLKGLTDPVVGLNMGQTAENLAYQFNISREAMDSFALRSHHRLAKAIDEHCLEEMNPAITNKGRAYDFDDGLRRETTFEKLGTLKPFFDKKFGKVTAGNSSQVTDGASLLILASETAVKEHNLPVLAIMREVQWAALDPAIMGLGPVHAATPILMRNKLKLDDIDYWEINEAFAAQVLACLAAWEDEQYCQTQLGLKNALGPLDQDRLNIDGGAIALGHPVGASGARVTLHLANVLQRKKAKRGIATLCVGGGQGGAVLLERTA